MYRHLIAVITACGRSFSAGRLWAGMCGLLFLCGCMTADLGVLPVHVSKGRPFVIARTDDIAGWGVTTHSYLLPFGSNILVAGYSADGDKVSARHAYCINTNLAENDWRPFAFSTNCKQLVMTVPMADATLIHSFQWCSRVSRDYNRWRVPNDRITREQLENLADPGPVDLALPEEYTYLAINWRGVVDTNGFVYVCAYVGFKGQFKASSILLRSVDQGCTYQCHSTIADPSHAPWGNEGPCEPDMVILPDGEFVCIMRTGTKKYRVPGAPGRDNMLCARSRDGGKTWERNEVMLPGIRPKLVLLANGLLAMGFGRPGNALAFSSNRGRSWGRVVDIAPYDVLTTGTVGLMQVAPNRLLAVYDGIGVDPRGIWLWERENINAIFGVYVDVKKLF